MNKNLEKIFFLNWVFNKPQNLWVIRKTTNYFWEKFIKTLNKEKYKKIENIIEKKEVSKKDFLEIISDNYINIDTKLIIKDFFDEKLTFEEIENLILSKKVDIYWKYILIKELDKTAENIEKLIKLWFDPHLFLYECDSDWWKIFDEILKRTLENKSDIYTEMRKISKEYIENLDKKFLFSESQKNKILKFFSEIQNPKTKNKVNLDEKEIFLSSYIRYWHKIDHPEIAELITIFFDELLKNWHFNIFSGIRIIPRFDNRVKPKKFIKNSWLKLYSYKFDNFSSALNYRACPIFFSHSAWPKNWDVPYIKSSWMKNEENSINIWFELENWRENYRSNIENPSEKNKNLEINDIFDSSLNSLENLSKRLIKNIDKAIEKVGIRQESKSFFLNSFNK